MVNGHLAALSVHQVKNALSEQVMRWLTTTAAVLAAAFLLYVLTAPPLMMAIARQQGSASFPAVYQPIVRVIESDFNGPLLWYFNDVWHSEIILIGEPSTPIKVISVYAIVGIVLLAAVASPFVYRWRIRGLLRAG